MNIIIILNTKRLQNNNHDIYEKILKSLLLGKEFFY